jgi:hypothetical protein
VRTEKFSPYREGFWIEEPVGNNAFSFDRRGPTPRLFVPSLIGGTLADVTPGSSVTFEEIDDDGQLKRCTGLAHLVRTTWRGVPAIVVDNHNHAFYFWFEARAAGRIDHHARLVHIDQHRDTRVPARFLPADATVEDAFTYTNYVLDVGNYIAPARQAGLVGESMFVTGSQGLDQMPNGRTRSTILNIDLDFFAPEMAYIDFDRARDFIYAWLSVASLVTIATSPYFIDQQLAIEALHRLVGTGD